MQRENVELLMGNHELFALSVMPYVNSPIDEINEEFYDEELRKKYFIWMWNGGDTTFDEFYKLSIKEQKEICDIKGTLMLEPLKEKISMPESVGW